MANKERNSILSHLKNLMMHIIKWNTQEDKKGNSWSNSIKNSREGIEKVQKRKPSLNDEFLKNNWNNTFDKAKKEAESEMQQVTKINSLTWKEVFFNKYTFIAVITFALFKLLT